MSFNAAILRAMQAEGLDLGACIRILEAGESKTDHTNAERQARHRAKKAESNAVTVTPVTPLPNDIDILTPPVPSTNSNELASPAELKPEHVVEAWNTTAERLGLRAILKLTPERRRKLATRIKQNTIQDFTEAIASIERSPFLRGENDRGWRADFDWMLEPKNFTKLTEGTYDR